MTNQDDSRTGHRDTEREIELANECITVAESALATLMPDLADRLGSSPEASGVAMSIIRRMLAGEIPYTTAQIAAGLASQAHELRWPNWQDGIAAPPSRICPSCATEMPGGFKRTWQWCPACGNAID